MWAGTGGGTLYPNLYILFVAPPGVGKSEVTYRLENILDASPAVKLSSDSVSKASLMDELNEANISFRDEATKQLLKYNSLTICSSEFAVLLPSYDVELMNALTHLYDCKGYKESRRSLKEEIKIKHAQVNLLGACTPAYIHNTLPDSAWEQGFTSRMLLVYAGKHKPGKLFFEKKDIDKEQKELKKLYAEITKLAGEMIFEPDVIDALEKWNQAGGPPQPEHPKLNSYNSRRVVHLLKLCMVSAASRLQPNLVQMFDFERALDWLLEIEILMPEIFKSAASGGTATIIKECWYYAYKAFAKTKEPVLESKLIHWLSMKVPAYQAVQILDIMERGKLLKKQPGKRGTEYVPQTKSEQE